MTDVCNFSDAEQEFVNEYGANVLNYFLTYVTYNVPIHPENVYILKGAERDEYWKEQGVEETCETTDIFAMRFIGKDKKYKLMYWDSDRLLAYVLLNNEETGEGGLDYNINDEKYMADKIKNDPNNELTYIIYMCRVVKKTGTYTADDHKAFTKRYGDVVGNFTIDGEVISKFTIDNDADAAKH